MKLFLESTKTFKIAIQLKGLSEDEKAANYAGNYMYMHTELKAFSMLHHFKNIETRQYIIITEHEEN